MKTEYVLLVAFLTIAAPVVDWLLAARGYKNLTFKMQLLFPCKELEELTAANDRVRFECVLYGYHQQVLNFYSTCDDKKAKTLFELHNRLYNMAISQLNATLDLCVILKTIEKGNEKIFRS